MPIVTRRQIQEILFGPVPDAANGAATLHANKPSQNIGEEVRAISWDTAMNREDWSVGTDKGAKGGVGRPTGTISVAVQPSDNTLGLYGLVTDQPEYANTEP